MKQNNDIPGLTAEDMQKLASAFEAEAEVSEVILYGSRAKETHRPGSDIDLTLRGHELSTSWLMELSCKIDDLLLPYEVDLSIFEHIDNQDLIDHINRVGKVIFKHEQ
jgi:uncharacterized protein